MNEESSPEFGPHAGDSRADLAVNSTGTEINDAAATFDAAVSEEFDLTVPAHEICIDCLSGGLGIVRVNSQRWHAALRQQSRNPSECIEYRLVNGVEFTSDDLRSEGCGECHDVALYLLECQAIATTEICSGLVENRGALIETGRTAAVIVNSRRHLGLRGRPAAAVALVKAGVSTPRCKFGCLTTRVT
ncbi:MAG: hypothetical protein ACJAZD_003396 [Ilumatobacter sp.]